MKEFEIKSHEAGLKLDKYLSRILSEAPKSFLYKMLRKKNIVLNDKKADGRETLCKGDNIKIYFSDETFEKFSGGKLLSGSTHPVSENIGFSKDPSENSFQNVSGKDNNRKMNASSRIEETVQGLNKNRSQIAKNISKEKSRNQDSEKNAVFPEIIYEDSDILILNKPSGMLSQKAVPSDYSANDFVLDYLLNSGQLTKEDLYTFKPSICNRLDRNTSGILIAGKSMHGLQTMGQLLKSRNLQKYYLCLVQGTVSEKQHIRGYLKKDHASNKVTVKKQPFAQADPIETSYEPIQTVGNVTLLKVHLITGRSHQIRAHLASMGHPILGDYKYGNRKQNDRLKKETGIADQMLHASELILPDGRKFEAPVPESFQKVLKLYNPKDSLKKDIERTCNRNGVIDS